ncbi:hypothetical protein ACS0TY_030805 [Phlomoides rotata]
MGFGNAISIPVVLISLAVELVSSDDSEIRLSRMLEFIIVDQESKYNGFLGRLFFTEFKAAASPYYYCVKFPTSRGIGIIRGDQRRARDGDSA